MDRYAIIGLGRFGRRLAGQLTSSGAEIIAIDRDPDIIEQIRDDVTLALRMDSTDSRALVAQGINKLDVAVVAMGTQFEAAAMTTAVLKSLSLKRIIARATSSVRGHILRSVGAHEVIYPEDESAIHLARRLVHPHLLDPLQLAPGYSLIQLQAPASFVGKTLRQLDLRNKYHINVAAIRRESPATERRDFCVVPLPDEVVNAEDTLIVLGGDADLQRLPAS